MTGTTPNSSATPTWTWISGGSGNGQFRFRLDNADLSTGTSSTVQTSYTPGTNLSDGSHTLYVAESSSTGQWSAAGSFEIVVDTMPPASPIISGSPRLNTTVSTWTWTPGGGGLGFYRYSLDAPNLAQSSTPTNLTTVTATLSEGIHILYVEETDLAGNWSSPASFITEIDLTPPNAPVVSGPAGIPSTTPTWTWVSGGNGGTGVFRIKLDSSAFSANDPTTTALSFTPTSALTIHPHTLNVQEVDAAGNWSPAGAWSIMVDDQAPVTGNFGSINVGTTTQFTVPLSWTAAQDNETNTVDITYQVFYSTVAANVANASAAVAHATAYQTPTANMTAQTVQGLTPATSYYFTVVATDKAGNHSAYVSTAAVATLPDSTPPIPGGTMGLTVTSVGSDRMTVNWAAATDDVTPAAQLTYMVVYSTLSNVQSTTNILTNGYGTAASYPQANIGSQTITGLSAGKPYYLNVVVWDANLNAAVYNFATQATLPFTAGSGTAQSPYLISNIAELQNAATYPSAHFQLANDIDASASYTYNGGLGFTPIGSAVSHFSGTFDGNGKTISHLYLANTGLADQGMFGSIDSGAMIMNLAVANAYVQGTTGVGGIVGHAYGGSLVKVSYQGAVNGSTVGLLIGNNAGASVTDAWAEGAVVGGDNAGGAVGQNGPSGSLQRVYAVANVFSNSATAAAVGGFAGSNGGLISDSFSFSMVGGVSGAVFGSFVGIETGTMSNVQALGGPLNPATCAQTGSSTGCTLESNGRYFYSRTNAPLAAWDFTSNWIYPDNNRLPVLSFQNHNAAVSFAPEILPGRRISSYDKAGYTLWGYCNSPGATINLTYTDSASAVDTAGASTCVGGMWTSTTNLSAAAQGVVTASVTQTVGMVTSPAVTKQLNKQTTFCDANPVVGSYAGGDGSSADPYTICTVAELAAVASNLGAGIYFSLMNNLDLSSGFSGIAGNFAGNFAGNHYVLSGATAPVFAGFSGTTAALANLNLENAAIIDTSVNFTGALVRTMACNSTTSIANVFVTGFVSSTHNDVGGVLGGACLSVTSVSLNGVGSTALTIGISEVGGISGATYASVDTNMSFQGYVFGATSVGGLTGHYHGTSVTGSNASAVVLGGAEAGGIVALDTGAAITNVNVNVNIYQNGINDNNHTSGGVLGHGVGLSISNINATGFVFGSNFAGGIVGYVHYGDATEDHSSFTGDVISPTGTVGGIVGQGSSPDTLSVTSNSTVVANLAGQVNVGGLVGAGWGNLSNSYVSANINCIAGQGSVGGITGSSGGTKTISGNTFTGTLTNAQTGGGIAGYSNYGAALVATNNYVVVKMNNIGSASGLVNRFYGASATNLTIQNNYAVVSGATDSGIIGRDGSTPGMIDHNFAILLNSPGAVGAMSSTTPVATYSNNYYVSVPGRMTAGNVGASQAGTTGVPNANYFMSPANAPLSAWDFTGQWKLPSSGGLPILIWQ